MTLYLYTITDDPLKFPKTLPEGATVTGSLRDQSVDVMRPDIIFTGSPGSGYNYAYIPDFGRYYFVDPPVTERTGIVRLPMRCDVLQSFAGQIIAAPVIIDRAAGAWNTYIPDPQRSFYAYRSNQYINIGDVGEPKDIIMVTVG